MDTVKEIRRRNLLELLRNAESDAAFARSLEVEPSYINQLRSGSRNLGDRTARKVEQLCNLPTGWMDQPHLEGAQRMSYPSVTDRAPNPPVRVGVEPIVKQFTPDSFAQASRFLIPILEIEGSMGVGRVQPEYETILGSLEINQDFIQTRLGHATSPRNIRIITGHGDSMKGTYEDGSPLFVDVGVKEIKSDATYVFALAGELFVKRLQRRPDGSLMVLSDNDKYPGYTISGEERERVQVVGRVIGAWNFEKL